MEPFSNMHRMANNIKVYNNGWYDYRSIKFSLNLDKRFTGEFCSYGMPYEFKFKNLFQSRYDVHNISISDYIESFLESSNIFHPFSSGSGEYIGKR